MFYNSSIVPENSNPDLLGAQISHGSAGFFLCGRRASVELATGGVTR